MDNPADVPVTRVLTIDYALLHFIDVYLASRSRCAHCPVWATRWRAPSGPLPGAITPWSWCFRGSQRVVDSRGKSGSKILPLFCPPGPPTIAAS